MSKLFDFTQVKGKWHKFLSFNLGVGAKLYKNFAQKLLAVSLCMAVVLLGTPVTTFADPHAHTTEYSGTKGDADYCLVCDVATKVNNLYRDSVDEITVENAAKVISQIHAIDQIKFELEDEQYEELIALTDGWSEGEYGELPSKYFKAKEKINELGLNGGWLAVEKKVLGVGGGWALDLSEAKVSLEVTPVEAAAGGTYVATSGAETMNLDMYGMYDNFSMVLNEATPDFRGQRSFYKRYDVNAGVIDNVNNNGWTTSFLLPAGTYRIREVNREAPMIVDGEEFHTGSTTYTYNGASTTSVVGEDDPGVVVQVTAGGVTPVTLVNYSTGSLTVSCAVDSPLASDEEKEFEFTVRLAYPTDPHLATELYEISLPSGTFGDMTFEGGVARFTLKNGESKTATRLPYWFGYTVESTAVDGFTVVSEGSAGTVEPSGQHEATFTFTRKTGDLAVSCTVDSHLESDKDQAFEFTVTLADTTINGTYGGMTFEDGVATFTLKSGESKAATRLPEGIGYTVEATDADGFAVTSDGASGAIEKDKSSSAAFTFTRETVPVTGVSLSDTTKSLAMGESFSLTPTISPEDATNKNVTWTSSDATVASVAENGTVKALKAGTTTITVTTEYGAKTATCEVTVKESSLAGFFSEPPAALSGLTFNDTSQQLISAGTLRSSPAVCHVEYAVVETCPAEDSLFWSDSLPMGTGAGTYKVWYRVVDLTFNKVLGVSEEPILVTIAQRSLADADVGFAGGPHYYTGSEVAPAVSVSLTGFGWLTNGTDYVVSYSNNTNAGTATVTITGTGNFDGTKTANFTINKKSLSGAEITIDPSTMVYTGKKLKPKITSVTVDGISVPSDAYRMKVSGKKQAGQTVTVTLTAKSNSNFKGSSKTTFTITKAAPSSEKLNGNPTLEATYGQTLGDIKEGLASAIGSFLGVDDQELEGVWAWEKDDTTKVGNVGKNKFTAIFTPTDGNYAKTAIDVTVKVSVDTSKWGDAQKRDADGKTQYVESSGKTSIELTEGNLGDGGILWLFEESYGKSAWYGIDLSTGAFDLDKGLRLYVRWLNPNDADYAEIYAQLDDAQKARVEGDNGWIFLIGVEDPDGKKVPPAHPVNVYVQLGDPNEGADWDLAHLKAYYITSGGDENVPVEDVPNFAYPGGTDEFGMMTLSHFSPYFIFDELTDEEKAALELKPEDGNNHPTDKPDSSGTDLPGTGDMATQMTVAALGMVLVLALGIMLKLITSKRKFEK